MECNVIGYINTRENKRITPLFGPPPGRFLEKVEELAGAHTAICSEGKNHAKPMVSFIFS